MKSKIKITFLILLLFFISLVYIGKNHIAKHLITKYLDSINVHTNIERVYVSISNCSVFIWNITIYNPPGFKEKVCAEIPELFLDLKFKRLLKGDIHFKEIYLNLDKLNIEKTEDEKVNLSEFEIVKQRDPSNKVSYRIDKLVLTLGTVRVYDDSKAILPRIITADMGITDAVFIDVIDLNSILEIVVNEIISNNIFLGFSITLGNIARLPLEGAGLIGDGVDKIIDITTSETPEEEDLELLEEQLQLEEIEEYPLTESEIASTESPSLEYSEDKEDEWEEEVAEEVKEEEVLVEELELREEEEGLNTESELLQTEETESESSLLEKLNIFDDEDPGEITELEEISNQESYLKE